MSSRVFVLALGTMQSLSVGMGIHVNNRVLIIKKYKKKLKNQKMSFEIKRSLQNKAANDRKEKFLLGFE